MNLQLFWLESGKSATQMEKEHYDYGLAEQILVASPAPYVSPSSSATTENERYYHELAEKFLRACPDGPFDYGAIRVFVKAAKTNNTVRGIYAALEDIKGPLPCTAPSEQARIANETHYRNLAEQMLQVAAQPLLEYASIRRFLHVPHNSKTVKGVYYQLEKLTESAPRKVGVGAWSDSWEAAAWRD